jgi:hypothetical protein
MTSLRSRQRNQIYDRFSVTFAFPFVTFVFAFPRFCEN